MTSLYLTSKQYEILTTLMKLNSDGSFLDLDQLLENINYQTTKASFQFSIRTLINHGLVLKHDREIRRGRKRCVLSLTEIGYKVTARSAPADDASLEFPSG